MVSTLLIQIIPPSLNQDNLIIMIRLNPPPNITFWIKPPFVIASALQKRNQNHPRCIAHKWIMDVENTKAKTKMNEGIIHTKINTFFIRVKFPCMKKSVKSRKLLSFLIFNFPFFIKVKFPCMKKSIKRKKLFNFLFLIFKFPFMNDNRHFLF